MEDLAESLQATRDRMETLQSLLKFPPWVQVVELIEKQATNREAPLLKTPLAGIDQALHLNYQLGIVAGMRLAIALPAHLEALEREAFTSMLREVEL